MKIKNSCPTVFRTSILNHSPLLVVYKLYIIYLLCFSNRQLPEGPTASGATEESGSLYHSLMW